MPSEGLDQELAAIKALIATLEPLSPDSRDFVLEAVFRKLKMEPPQRRPAGDYPPPTPSVDRKAPDGIHIKDFKEQKRPKSVNEMVALVAFYLSNVAPLKDRKETVTPKDLETQFKIAGYRLPKALRATLSNTAQSGYVEMVKKGVYKLTPIGYNLIAHTLPRHE